MKSKLVLAVIACLVVTADAQELWSGESQRPRALVYTLEGLGALGGCVGCLCVPVGAAYACGIDVFSDQTSETEQLIFAFFLAVSALPLPAAVGLGVAGVGNRLDEDGSTGAAVLGAYGGAAVSVGLWLLASQVAASQMDGPSPLLLAATASMGVVGVLAIPVGAVVGYNLGAPSKSVGGRLQAPSVALTGVELPDHSVEYGVKVQLAGLRF
jgi:hypothetical protein